MKKIKKKAAFFDTEIFEYIQPCGGLTFREPSYITAGDGYIRVLHIYQLPKSLNDFWLDKIFGIDDAVITMDISTKNIAEVKKNINRSLKEEYSRRNTAKDFAEVYDAERRQEELMTMFDELSSFGEVVKMVDFRIFVMGRNLVELDERCERLLKSLEGDTYIGSTFLNEGKREWQSLFESYTVQHGKPFSMRAHPLLTEQLAYGDPYHYSELIDPCGTLLGFTDVDGVVLFDEFTKTETRKHYNSLCCGDMGSGKSTLLKKRFKAHAAKGSFLRVFDITGEFKDLTEEFGGKIIKCNGNSGMLNPLEILKAGDDEYTSYARHISKVSAFFRCIVPSISDGGLIVLQNYLRELYQSMGLTPEEGGVTGLPASRYPALSDFLAYLEESLQEKKAHGVTSRIDEAVVADEAIELNKIVNVVRNLVINYGNMFDGITSVDNITDEKIVTFDISDIKDLGNVFAAQMFNMVGLCWDNAVGNGTVMKGLWEQGKLDARDITDFLILIDESHRWVNTRMPDILDLLIKYLREARKYFAGITFASQSVRDFAPEGTESPNVNLIKTLFELTQYKFMFKQDSSAIPLINSIFNNELTFSQVEEIPFLTLGEVILSISGDRSIKFKVWLSESYEKGLFAGGR